VIVLQSSLKFVDRYNLQRQKMRANPEVMVQPVIKIPSPFMNCCVMIE